MVIITNKNTILSYQKLDLSPPNTPKNENHPIDDL